MSGSAWTPHTKTAGSARDRLYHEALSRITVPYAYGPEFLTEDSPACPRGRLPHPGGAAIEGSDARAAVWPHAGQVPDHIPNTPRN